MKLVEKLKNLMKNYLTDGEGKAEISKSRAIGAPESREIGCESAYSENQKTISKEMVFGASTGACSGLVNRIISIASVYLLSRAAVDNSHEAVEVPGIEPGRHGLTNPATQPATPTANPSYQENSGPATSKILIKCPYPRQKNNSLIALFNSQNNQGAGNDQQRAKDIKNSHSVSDIIHNNYLDNVKLKIQQNTERSNPEITKSQFVEPPITGSMSIEAKNTCPISRNISDKVSILTDENDIRSNYNSEQQVVNTSKIIIKCPYCSSGEFVKRGTRQKKREKVQLYICKTCGRTFTPFSLKGKHYPLNVILDAISYYNLGFSLEQVSNIMKKKQDIDVQPSTIANWYDEHKEICTYNRMRPFAVKEFSPHDVIETCTLAHRQLYRFRYHRAKTKYIMEDDFKHYKFYPLKEFLDNVTAETPHQYFQEGLRASEAPLKFSKTEMIVRNKENFATRIAKMILEGVKENKMRHEALQKFMIANDSVTVATEVPVYIRREDLAHIQTQLGFKIFLQKKDKEMRAMENDELPKLITGHIDFLQIRNGSVHIMDYKSNAAKERPIEQLTLYALALSRLTGLRVFHFKCAWFDEKDYFEFFPLHAVYKPRHGRKKVYTKEGEYDINDNAGKIEKIRPGKTYK